MRLTLPLALFPLVTHRFLPEYSAVLCPLEAHHFFIERCLANVVDWKEFCEYIDRLKALVDRADAFCKANPELQDVIQFVDNMEVNGMLIEKPLHTGQGKGIHNLPFPLWQGHCYGKDGYQFSQGDVLYHEDEHPATDSQESK